MGWKLGFAQIKHKCWFLMIVYAIKNKINGKAYVGQTVKSTVEKRYPGGWHRMTKNPGLKAAALKYGLENFEVSIVDYAENMEELNKKEFEWAEKLNSYSPHGYNIRTCGEQPTWQVPRGEEFRAKISKAKKGCKVSEETKAMVSDPVFCSNGQTYPSMIEAARQLGLRPGHVSECVAGKRKWVGNHSFCLSSDPRPLETRPESWVRPNKRKSVLNTETGEIFCTGTEAAKASGRSQSYISESCRGLAPGPFKFVE